MDIKDFKGHIFDLDGTTDKIKSRLVKDRRGFSRQAWDKSA